MEKERLKAEGCKRNGDRKKKSLHNVFLFAVPPCGRVKAWQTHNNSTY
jgi:hypothetical protein